MAKARQSFATRASPGVSLELFAQFLQSFLPIKANDVPFYYHVPRTPYFDAATAPVRKAIFSITPTGGVYDALAELPSRSTADRYNNTGVIVAFIHRPFTLDRYRIPRRTGVVLSSHKSLDEVLTTGWNVQLAFRLGIDLHNSVCIQGYKDDPERRIGLVGTLDTTEESIQHAIWQEFGAWEAHFGFASDVPPVTSDGIPRQDVEHSTSIKVIAIMNAFHPEEVERVANAAVEAGFITNADLCHEVLYLTGAVRQPGVEAALSRGMKIICVGHKVCEDWGIRFLASQVRAQFPDLEIVEVDEPEEPRPPRPQQTVA